MQHMLAVEFTIAVTRSPGSYTNWETCPGGCSRPELTGLPLRLQRLIYEADCRRCSLWSHIRVHPGIVPACPGTEAMSPSQITSLVDTVKLFFVKKTEKEQLLRLLLSQLPQKQTCKFQQHQFQAKLAVELANITPKEQKLSLLVSRLKLAFCLHNTLTLTLSVFKTRQRKMGRGKDLRTEMRTRQRYLGSCSNSEG